MSLQYVLLALLSKESDTGYGMGRVLRTQLNHLWNARLQQIYSELAKLESQGLVVSESFALPNRPAKKVYTLTTSGFDALDHWLTLPPTPISFKNDLYVKLYALDRMPKELVLQRLTEQQATYEERSDDLREKLAEAREKKSKELGRLLTLEAALVQAEAQTAWASRAITAVEKSGGASSPARRKASKARR